MDSGILPLPTQLEALEYLERGLYLIAVNYYHLTLFLIEIFFIEMISS
jgi:hypothetical protein